MNLSLDEMNANTKGSLMENLGIQYTVTTPERVEATMMVDNRTRQPFGILHGGATLALAETLAGAGSYLIIDEAHVAVGMQVSGNHISSAVEGTQVRGIATPIHIGEKTHVWNIDVVTMDGRLISTVRVTNAILPHP